MSVGIIGLGRMGSLLCRRFAPHCSLVVYDQDEQRAAQLAGETGAQQADFAEAAAQDILVLALPTPAVVPVVKELAPKLKVGQVLVNIATTQAKADVERIVGNNAFVVSAKIIGHAVEIAAGETPVVVIDGEDEGSMTQVGHLFSHLGRVTRDSEAVVEQLNTIAAAEGVRAAYIIKKRMEEQGINVEYWETAVRIVAAGTMKAFASGDAGPFARKVIKTIEEDNNAQQG